MGIGKFINMKQSDGEIVLYQLAVALILYEIIGMLNLLKDVHLI